MSEMASSQFKYEKVSELDCKQTAVRAVSYNSDGNYCLTCGADKSVKLWNPARQLLLQTYHGHGYEVLDARGSCDNAQLVSCGADKVVVLWDVATGKAVRKFRGHAGKVNCVRFNEESTVVVSGSEDGSVKTWDCRSRNQEPIQVLPEAKDVVMCLHVSNQEIFSASLDCHIRRYDLRLGKLFDDFVSAAAVSVTLSRDGQCVLCSTLDSTCRLLDKDTGDLLNEFKGAKNSDYKIDSCLNNADTVVFSGSEDGYIYCWDLLEAKLLGKLEHVKGRIAHTLSHHPTQPTLISAARNSLYVWADANSTEEEAQ